MSDSILGILGLSALLLPVVASFVIGIPWALGVRLSEGAIKRVISGAFLLTFIACLGIDGLLLARPDAVSVVTLAHWMVLPDYVIDARVVFDLPAATLMTLTAGLCGLVGAFSAPYLHKDPGYHRFFVLLTLFAAGMMAVACADTLDLLYVGWEIVGLASALLIAYFNYREAPVRNGLRAFAIYRICDVALLTAAVTLHHSAGGGSLSGATPDAEVGLFVALLLVFASMGKAAAFPFTGWLPRAMEGPTPSSAIFYGALSIHAGPFLLIRAWPLLVEQPVARVAVVAIGAITALHAATVGRTQTDIKSSLGYASVTQAGVILMIIGAGFPRLALLHMVGHAILRTWQLLRAPSLLHDHHEIVDLLGGSRPGSGGGWERLLPLSARRFAYRMSLERWFLDDLAASRLIAPAVRGLRGLDKLDQRWTSALTKHDEEAA